MSTAESAATVDYIVQNTPDAYVYDIACWMDATKVKVSLRDGRLFFVFPTPRRGWEDTKAAGPAGGQPRQLKLPRGALLDESKLKIEAKRGSGGLKVTVLKATA